MTFNLLNEVNTRGELGRYDYIVDQIIAMHSADDIIILSKQRQPSYAFQRYAHAHWMIEHNSRSEEEAAVRAKMASLILGP